MSDKNPWLEVSASHYEGHMNHPSVVQLGFLSRVLESSLRTSRPRSLAVPGCATGTGFEHIDPDVTKRVLAVDINPEYVEILKMRYQNRLPGLEAVCADLVEFEAEAATFDLVFAALVFEYVDPGILLEKLARWVSPGGRLLTVLQLPGSGGTHVSETPFLGVRVLESVLRCVDPEAHVKMVAGLGLCLKGEKIERLDSGKEFHLAEFTLENKP